MWVPLSKKFEFRDGTEGPQPGLSVSETRSSLAI